jgi:hypothetical protein
MPVPSQHPVLPPSSVWYIFPLDVKLNGEARIHTTGRELDSIVQPTVGSCTMATFERMTTKILLMQVRTCALRKVSNTGCVTVHPPEGHARVYEAIVWTIEANH